MTVDEGYVKFRARRTTGLVCWSELVVRANQLRTELFDRGLIGVYPNGVGFGNLSVRKADHQFWITGTGTGALRELGPEHWCLVERFSIEENSVRVIGVVNASSESMTHGAIYLNAPEAKCVIHVHHRALFEHLLTTGAPRTPAEVSYGTPAMAQEVASLVQSLPVSAAIFAMAGHQDGVIVCGNELEALRSLLLTHLDRANSESSTG